MEGVPLEAGYLLALLVVGVHARLPELLSLAGIWHAVARCSLGYQPVEFGVYGISACYVHHAPFCAFLCTYIRRVMRPLLPTTLRPPSLESPHLVERESQRLRKLGNGVPASFPRPAFHIPYGGRGYPTLLGEFLYGKPPLLPYPPQLQAQPFVAHAPSLFKIACASSEAPSRMSWRSPSASSAGTSSASAWRITIRASRWPSIRRFRQALNRSLSVS